MWQKKKAVARKTALGLILIAVFCASMVSCKNDDNSSTEQKTVTVTFLSGDGYWLEGEKKVTEKKVSVPYESTGEDQKPIAPILENFQIAGWFKKQGDEVSEIAYTFVEPIKNPLVLQARWKNTVSDHILSFDTRGGSKVASQTVTYGKTPTQPADPTLKDKYFVGWYADADCLTSFDFTKQLATNMTAYARWVDFKGSVDDFNAYASANKDRLVKGSGLTLEFLFVDDKATEISFTADAEDAIKNTKNAYTFDYSGMTAVTGAVTKFGTKVLNDGEEIDTGIVAVIFPSNATGVGRFAYCSHLQRVILPSSLEKVQVSAFEGCTALTASSVIWPETGNITIGSFAFSDCTGLKSMTIPGSVKVVHPNAFFQCSNLEELSFSEGVEDIEAYPVASNDKKMNLRRVRLPQSLKILWGTSFCFDHNVTKNIDFTYNGTMEEYKEITVNYPATDPSQFPVKCTDGTVIDSGLGISDN